MVKVVINNKGVEQKRGADLEIQSTFLDSITFFNKQYSSAVETVANAVTSSFSDSGTTYILGSLGGNCLGLPAMSSANIGYTARIIVTGALNATSIAEAAQDDDRFLLAVADRAGSAKINKITTATNNLNFLDGCANATQPAVVHIEYINENKAVVLGMALT